MAYGTGDSTAGSAGSFPIARSFALVTLFALIGLALLRKLFGSISVSASV